MITWKEKTMLVFDAETLQVYLKNNNDERIHSLIHNLNNNFLKINLK